MKSLALYIHVPFCIRKCYYCDFLSFPEMGSEMQRRYFQVLLKEIDEACAALPKQSAGVYEVSSVYFGGGTPSYPDEKLIEKVINHIHDHFQVRMDAEITLEINPGTVTYDKLKAYKAMGVNRLSIGAQSMMNMDLEHLGRAHNVAQFYEAYRNARTAGFRNISVDIMMGLPGQTTQDYLNTLREVAECKPEHISSYSLTIEEGTPYYEIYGTGKTPRIDNTIGLSRLPLPDDDEERKMYEATNHYLINAGYHRYEISNFARNDESRPRKYESRHNIVYWTRGDYLGFGLGASSMINNTRFSNTRDLNDYIESDGRVTKLRENISKLDINAQIEEFMFLGLRMSRGVSNTRFEANFGVPMREVYGDVIDALEAAGLVATKEDALCLTPRGVDVSNQVLAYFLMDLPEDGAQAEQAAGA